MAYDESWMYDEPSEFIYGINVDPWIERVMLYCLIFAFILGIFSNLEFISSVTEEDSARYLLSSLVQGEAAVFALVITLSLVVVQIAASSYSVRVIHIFKRLPDLWILIFIYIFTIFYSLAILKMIDQVDQNVNDLTYDISFSFILGVFAFIALVPYFLNVIEFTNPYTLLSHLAKSINEDKIIMSHHIGDQNDPFQPLMDIIYSSFNKYDMGIVIEGMEAMESKIMILLKSTKKEEVNIEKINEIANRFLSHLSGLAKVIVDRRDEDASILALNIFGRIGTEASKGDLNQVTDLVIWSLGPVGINCAENHLEEPASRAIFHIKSIGDICVENLAEEEVIWAISGIDRIAIKSAQNQLVWPLSMAATCLGSIAVKACEMKIEKAIDRSVWSLQSYGILCGEKRLEPAAANVLLSLCEIVSAYIKKSLDDKAAQVIVSFDIIGVKFLENNLAIAAIQVVESLKKIGIEAANRKQEKVSIRVAESLGSTGLNAAEKNLKEITGRVIASLGSLGSTLAKSNSEKGTISAVKSLEKIALKCIVLNSLDLTISAINSIRNIGETIFYKKDATINLENDDETARRIAESLAAIASKANSQDLIEILHKLIFEIRYIGQLSAREKFPRTAFQTAESFRYLSCQLKEAPQYKILPLLVETLNNVGSGFAQNGFDAAVCSISNAFLHIIEITNDHKEFENRENIRFELVKALRNIGEIAAKENFPKASGQTISMFGYFCDPSSSLKNHIKESLESIFEKTDDVYLLCRVSKLFNLHGFFFEAEKASNKAISLDHENECAYYELCEALKGQEIHFSNNHEDKKAREVHEKMDVACRKNEELSHKPM